MTALSLLMLILSSGDFTISNPQALEPYASRLVGDVVYYENDFYKIRLTPLTYDVFRDHMLKLGVKPNLIDREEVRDILSEMAVFRIDLLNRGEDNMVFNPDQAMIRGKRGPDGFLVDMASFWPQNLPDMNIDAVRLARVFRRGSVELAPGEKHMSLIAFTPTRKQFRKKVTLELERLYYGIETFSIHCQFDIRYAEQ